MYLPKIKNRQKLHSQLNSNSYLESQIVLHWGTPLPFVTVRNKLYGFWLLCSGEE